MRCRNSNVGSKSSVFFGPLFLIALRALRTADVTSADAPRLDGEHEQAVSPNSMRSDNAGIVSRALVQTTSKGNAIHAAAVNLLILRVLSRSAAALSSVLHRESAFIYTVMCFYDY